MMAVKRSFGTLSDGREAALFTLEAGGLALSISEWGAAWTSLCVPSRRGGRDDVLLGFATLDGYIHNNPGFGITVGRFANRISGAKFTLNGKTYRLFPNDGAHTLHGGRVGYSRKLWKGEAFTERGGVFVRFELESPDGDEGFPGNLRAAATYGLTPAAELSALYEAFVDAPCPVNLTNHAYFNLAGEGRGTILGHELKLYASKYVEPDAALIPTGKLLPVEGTPFDFRKAKTIGRDFAAACNGDTEAVGTGYDHCFVVDGYRESAAPAVSSTVFIEGKPAVSGGLFTADKPLLPCAEVFEPESGRRMKLSTTQPGVQFYSGNFLTGVPGKAGSVYGKNAGLCLETQHFPDSPNRPEFPDAVFGPGRDYREQALFRFEW